MGNHKGWSQKAICQLEGTLRVTFQGSSLWEPREKYSYSAHVFGERACSHPFIQNVNEWLPWPAAGGAVVFLHVVITSLMLLMLLLMMMMMMMMMIFFLARMLVFCSKIWYSRFIVCSVMAIFFGASSVILSECERFPWPAQEETIIPIYAAVELYLCCYPDDSLVSVARILASSHGKGWLTFILCSAIIALSIS